MQRRLQGSFALVLLGIAWPLCAAAQTLTLCYEDADVRPWRMRDRHGLNLTLIDRAAKASGVTIKYEITAWQRCMADLKANRVDGAFAASFKEDRLGYGAYPGGNTPDVSKRLHVERYVVLRKRGSPVDWDGQRFHRLVGPVGTQLGYSINDVLQKIGVTTDDGAQSAEALVQKLIAGYIGAAAMQEGEAHAVLRSQPGRAERLEILPRQIEEKPYFLMLSHAFVKTSPELAERFWKAIETTRSSREYQKEEREARAAMLR